MSVVVCPFGCTIFYLIRENIRLLRFVVFPFNHGIGSNNIRINKVNDTIKKKLSLIIIIVKLIIILKITNQ